MESMTVKAMLLDLIHNNLNLVNDARTTAQVIERSACKHLRAHTARKFLLRNAGLRFLSSLMVSLENHIQSRLQAKGVLYWLMLSRKLPLDEFIFPAPEFKSTRAQIRRTFDLAIIKHAPRKSIGMVKSEQNRWAPVVTKGDLQMFFEAYFLTENLYYVASCFRRAYKGASIQLHDDTYDCFADPSSEESMRLLDARKETFGGVLDGFGYASYMYKHSLEDVRSRISEEPMITQSSFSWDEHALFIAPSILLPKDMFKLFLFWQDMDVQIRGLQPLELILGLSALTWSRWAFDQPGLDHRLQIAATDLGENGFSMVEKGAIEADLRYVWPIILDWYAQHIIASNIRVTADSVPSFLKSCAGSRSADIHTWTEAPLIVHLEELDLIDWMSVSSFIRDLLPSTVRTQRVKLASERGFRFEAELKNYLFSNISSGLKNVFVWPENSSQLGSRQTTKTARDVDLGIVLDDTLLLVECKVKLGIIGSLEEERKWYDTMDRASREWLIQVDSAADALARGETTLDGHTLPIGIRKIIPLVCTPHVIHISPINKHLMLTGQIPRVCTPSELLLLVNQRPPELFTSDAIKYVTHN